jgi:hypothetical protein
MDVKMRRVGRPRKHRADTGGLIRLLCLVVGLVTANQYRLNVTAKVDVLTQVVDFTRGVLLLPVDLVKGVLSVFGVGV